MSQQLDFFKVDDSKVTSVNKQCDKGLINALEEIAKNKSRAGKTGFEIKKVKREKSVSIEGLFKGVKEINI